MWSLSQLTYFKRFLPDILHFWFHSTQNFKFTCGFLPNAFSLWLVSPLSTGCFPIREKCYSLFTIPFFSYTVIISLCNHIFICIWLIYSSSQSINMRAQMCQVNARCWAPSSDPNTRNFSPHTQLSVSTIRAKSPGGRAHACIVSCSVSGACHIVGTQQVFNEW